MAIVQGPIDRYVPNDKTGNWRPPTPILGVIGAFIWKPPALVGRRLRYQPPSGPPYGAWTRYEVRVQVPGIRRPRVRTRSE